MDTGEREHSKTKEHIAIRITLAPDLEGGRVNALKWTTLLANFGQPFKFEIEVRPEFNKAGYTGQDGAPGVINF